MVSGNQMGGDSRRCHISGHRIHFTFQLKCVLVKIPDDVDDLLNGGQIDRCGILFPAYALNNRSCSSDTAFYCTANAFEGDWQDQAGRIA